METKPVSFVQIELTNYCNYRCGFCPQSLRRSPRDKGTLYNRERGFMPFDLFRRITAEAGKIAREINFSFFGEPMMHPRVLEFMGTLKDREPELRVVMNTNLSLATKEIFEKLIEIKMDELRLSIDAASSRMYETVRPGGHCLDLDGKTGQGDRFDVICKKAEYWFSIPAHVPTRHVFTVSSRNAKEMNAFADRWLPLLGDRDAILFKNVLSYGGKIADEMLVPHPCNVWDLKSLTVDWKGRVSPCNLDTNMDLTIGSITGSSLMELFQSEKMRQIRALSIEKKILPCQNCIDANNWSRNIRLRKGETLTELKVSE